VQWICLLSYELYGPINAASSLDKAILCTNGVGNISLKRFWLIKLKHCYCLLFNNVFVLAISNKDGQYRPCGDVPKWDKEMYMQMQTTKRPRPHEQQVVQNPTYWIFSETLSALDVWQDIWRPQTSARTLWVKSMSTSVEVIEQKSTPKRECNVMVNHQATQVQKAAKLYFLCIRMNSSCITKTGFPSSIFSEMVFFTCGRKGRPYPAAQTHPQLWHRLPVLQRLQKMFMQLIENEAFRKVRENTCKLKYGCCSSIHSSGTIYLWCLHSLDRKSSWCKRMSKISGVRYCWFFFITHARR